MAWWNDKCLEPQQAATTKGMGTHGDNTSPECGRPRKKKKKNSIMYIACVYKPVQSSYQPRPGWGISCTCTVCYHGNEKKGSYQGHLFIGEKEKIWRATKKTQANLNVHVFGAMKIKWIHGSTLANIYWKEYYVSKKRNVMVIIFDCKPF